MLPWWQLRVAASDESGDGTWVFSADVWRASTPAALAVVAAAVVSVVLVTTRGHAPQQRGAGLVIACIPVVLLGWTAWSIGRLTAAPHEYSMTVTTLSPEAVGDMVLPDFHIVHDGLEIRPGPGYAEGPAWGLYVSVALVLAVTAWAAVRLLRPPKPQ